MNPGQPRPFATTTLVAGLMLACGALLLAARTASADTITLKDDGRCFTGRVKVARPDVDHVEFELDLFKTPAPGGHLTPLTLTVPREMLKNPPVRDRGRRDRVTVAANASPAEKLDAASKMIAAGCDQLVLAGQLFREVLADGNANAPAAAEGVLRLSLPDMVAAYAAGDAATRERLRAELVACREGVAVIDEYAAVLALKATLKLRPSWARSRVPDELRKTLHLERDALRRFVADAARRQRHNWSDADQAAWRDGLAARTARIELLVRAPGSMEALAAAPLLDDCVPPLLSLLELCRALGDELAGRIHATVTQHTGEWRSLIDPALVLGTAHTQLLEDHKSAAVENGLLVDALQRRPGARRDDLARDREVIDAVNDWRLMLGLAPLRLDLNLYDCALAYSGALLGRALEHNIGGTPAQRAARAGFRGREVGENLFRAGAQVPTRDEIVRDWQQSPEHHENLLRESFGFAACAHKGKTWVMMFGGQGR